MQRCLCTAGAIELPQLDIKFVERTFARSVSNDIKFMFHRNVRQLFSQLVERALMNSSEFVLERQQSITNNDK